MSKRIVPRNGDITDTHAMAVVNAGNTSLWLGSGVAGAIRTKGGPSVAADLHHVAQMRANSPRRYVRDPSDGKIWRFPCELGEIVVTHGGNMRAHFVLHAAVMDCKGPEKAQTDEAIVYICTKNAVLKARELSLYGISFPIFGTGVGGMDIYDSASVMVQALMNFAPDDQHIRLYAYGVPAYNEVVKAISNKGAGDVDS